MNSLVFEQGSKRGRALFGAGGLSHDIRACTGFYGMPCFVDEKYWQPNRDEIYPLSKFDPERWELIVAIGNPKDKQNVIKRLPSETKYWSYVHPSSQIFWPHETEIGEGTFIAANSILVCHNTIGKYCHLNFAFIFGHDATIGDYFCSGAGVCIAGNCKIGNRVYLGSNASIKEKITVCDDVTIGMGAVVVKDIIEPGIYAGVPAKRIK